MRESNPQTFRLSGFKPGEPTYAQILQEEVTGLEPAKPVGRTRVRNGPLNHSDHFRTDGAGFEPAKGGSPDGLANRSNTIMGTIQRFRKSDSRNP